MNTFIELPVYVDFEVSESGVTANGVWLCKEGRDDLDITPYLNAKDLESAAEAVQWVLEREADRLEAAREDCLDGLAEEKRLERHLEKNREDYRQMAAEIARGDY